ncbi:MAG: ATP-binding cassette domain-containing protein [Caldithrix sp.]|nr:ATP-binding cassette domain-containing protein [Caldithrix sp.]
MRNEYFKIYDLQKYTGSNRTRFLGSNKSQPILQNISLNIYENQTLGIIGESGSGKTTLGLCLARLKKIDAGRIIYKGRDITYLPYKNLKSFRRNVQVIFQNPAMVLNPVHTVATILAEPLSVIMNYPKSEINDRIARLLNQVGLSTDVMFRYPDQLSGGQKQRVAISRALAVDPEFIIADEPASSLDADLKQKIIGLLMELKDNFGLSLLIISHDLKLVARIADRIAVMHKGSIVEHSSVEQIVNHPRHVHTKTLLSVANPFPKFGKNDISGKPSRFISVPRKEEHIKLHLKKNPADRSDLKELCTDTCNPITGYTWLPKSNRFK